MLDENRKLLPVEVKASGAIGTGDARHLRRFREHHVHASRCIVLSTDPGIRVLSPGIIAAPWWAVV